MDLNKQKKQRNSYKTFVEMVVVHFVKRQTPAGSSNDCGCAGISAPCIRTGPAQRFPAEQTGLEVQEDLLRGGLWSSDGLSFVILGSYSLTQWPFKNVNTYNSLFLFCITSQWWFKVKRSIP